MAVKANTGSTSIDPLFSLPDGVVDMHYSDTDESIDNSEVSGAFGSDVTGSTVYQDTEVEYLDESDLIPVPFVPDVPEYLEIVDQSIHTGSTGSQVIDVTISVEDVPKAVRYEVRVTKEA